MLYRWINGTFREKNEKIWAINLYRKIEGEILNTTQWTTKFGENLVFKTLLYLGLNVKKARKI